MLPPGNFRLSRWTGEFLDRQLERSFQAEAWPRHCLTLRWIALIAGFLYAVMLYPTWQGFGPGSAFRILLALRLGTAVCLWAIAYVSRPTWPQRRVQLLVLLTILFMVATRMAENGLAPQRLPVGPGPGGFVFPVMPLIIFAVVAIPLRLALVWSAVGALLVLRDQVIWLGFHAALAQLTLANFLVAVGVGYAFRVSWNRITRHDFALRQTLGREVAERQAAEQEARRANAAKSRFLAVMSHEIRTPLNGVLGGMQILAGGALLPGQRQPLELASHSCEQLALLLDEILDLARIEADHLELAREAFRPDALLEAVHAVLYPQAQAKGLALRVERPAQLPPALEGDLLRLRQVLINLAGNGVKFTEQGEVVLSLQVDPLDPAAKRVRCTFTVRDTGPGLKPEDQERIWAPFEQGDGSIRRRHGGAGLGLAISRELVAAMGGKLSLESSPGHGCRFRFAVELPTAEAPAGPAPPAPPPPPRPQHVAGRPPSK
ncbi:MAG: ATP-binding protein, partial [Holophaga sp.]|nr:ATP-binding protein [Holophaga sp.]